MASSVETSHGLHCPSPGPRTLLCLWWGESAGAAGAEGGGKHPKGPEARCCLVLWGFRSFLGCLGLASLSYSPKEVFPVPTAAFIVPHLKHGCSSSLLLGALWSLCSDEETLINILGSLFLHNSDKCMETQEESVGEFTIFFQHLLGLGLGCRWLG